MGGDEPLSFSFGGAEEVVEEKRSLVGTALARSRATTRTEKRLIESDLFEPLLANLLAFVKAFQRKHKAENPPPAKPGREPLRIPEAQMKAIVQTHDEMLRAFSRSYLTIIIEFSDHRCLLADQKFFKWLHAMLCQFIENSLEKNDPELMDAVQYELHRIFQGDRFNVEAKQPHQIQRIHKRKMRKWALMRHCPALSKEMVKNSPVVGHILPSPAEKIQTLLKDLERNSFAGIRSPGSNKSMPEQACGQSSVQRPKTSTALRSSPGPHQLCPRPQSSASNQFTHSIPSSVMSPTVRKGICRSFVTDVKLAQSGGSPQGNEQHRPPSQQMRAAAKPGSLPAHGGWEGRVHALSLLEKRQNWKVKVVPVSRRS